MEQILASAHKVDPEYYSRVLLPSRTRNCIPLITNIPFEKKRLSISFILNPSTRVLNAQGFKSSDKDDKDDKYYYIHLDPYESSSSNAIEEVSPLIVNPTNFQVGSFYTYVTASVVGTNRITKKTVDIKPIQLYTTKVVNMYEFGTKHQQIFYRMALIDQAELFEKYEKIEYRLYVAGEIMCVDENTLMFNFFSGTYKMKKYISKRRAIHEEAYITHMMQEYTPVYKNILFNYCPFINPSIVPLTRCELERLQKYNVPVFSFDVPAKCKNMRNAVLCHKNVLKKDTVSIDELHSLMLRI